MVRKDQISEKLNRDQYMNEERMQVSIQSTGEVYTKSCSKLEQSHYSSQDGPRCRIIIKLKRMGVSVEVDDADSFKKPGAVPFKWEIKPGLPAVQQKLHHHQKPEPPSPKLRPPPPAGSYLYSPVEPGTRSFRSNSRVRSDRWRFERPLLARTESVSSACFFSPFLRRLRSRKTVPKRVVEEDYASELETLGRWSLSSRKSLSPFRTSTASSSVASSPRPVTDADWAGFGLF
ncbi:hypothetical protein VNO77_10291 [Canavalia gladiata]|uniref:Uncharacterized protein n=1 Tax=Canavalia gladiata TaxID=3824 RepID=A0AAN9MA83_CANGL